MRKYMNLKIVATLFAFLFLVGCNDDDDNYIDDWNNSILMLQVDYSSYELEAGQEFLFSDPISTSDTIPIGVDYDEPSDFGNVSLYYAPTDDVFFFGTVVWNGKGEVKYPYHWVAPSSFLTIDTPVDQPAETNFQLIHSATSEENIDYAAIWDAVDDLSIVDEYISSGKKVGLFLYQPSVGAGDPDDWDWYVILNHEV